MEWFHRLVAGTISTILLITTALVLTSKQLREKYLKICLTAIGLVAVQIILGGMTVLGLLHPRWVSSHLLVGLFFFTALLWLALVVWESKTTKKSFSADTQQKARKSRRSIFASIILLFVQLFLGGLVSSNYAGLSCEGFPTCNGAWLPDWNQWQQSIQWVHRLGAVLLTLHLLGVFFRTKAHLSFFGSRGILAFRLFPILLSLQWALGLTAVFAGLPLLISVAHLATGTALLACFVVMANELRNA